MSIEQERVAAAMAKIPAEDLAKVNLSTLTSDEFAGLVQVSTPSTTRKPSGRKLNLDHLGQELEKRGRGPVVEQ